MHFNTWHQVRHQRYDCFERSADALFNLSDALLSELQARSCKLFHSMRYFFDNYVTHITIVSPK
jgi:hypothetical protein